MCWGQRLLNLQYSVFNYRKWLGRHRPHPCLEFCQTPVEGLFITARTWFKMERPSSLSWWEVSFLVKIRLWSAERRRNFCRGVRVWACTGFAAWMGFWAGRKFPACVTRDDGEPSMTRMILTFKVSWRKKNQGSFRNSFKTRVWFAALEVSDLGGHAPLNLVPQPGRVVFLKKRWP